MTDPLPKLPPQVRQDTPRDKRIPYYFVGAFVLLFIVDAILVTIAVTTQTGVVVDHHYERGLNYNEYIAENEKQKALGWQGHVELRDGNVLRFTLKDAAGKPLTKAEPVQVDIIRTVQDGMDFSATLAETAPGVYEKKIDFPKHGLWTVRVRTSWQNNPYILESHIEAK